MAERFTIEALTEEVRRALEGHEEPASGRVRAVPDVRTIRYYTTLGLLDRPAEMRGRTALYAHRHLLQLVAIKRLQAEGRSLEEVQTELAGASDAVLARLARLEASAPGPRIEPERSFWRDAPAETAPPPRALEEPWALRLAPGVLLVVERTSHPTAAQHQRLTRLAAPLVEALKDLGSTEGQEG